ncbi:mechanosensitive ion channel family protein [Limnofasciculus baicalensis]|uniref:Mechanosensitive ion channel n=1 Tax=Limnofasciculus baicalensis BBK-W-15 TaxID=2699891 RepID=A0AAE3GPB4_9CYAN|nr:mechanosensitive ion channel domain-containing protein [Limnofasciculus baicalensis]MCP2727521.1 mechanosensitive ion channel [Limnofasciculus baicalensis BBK-W-15]
MKKYWRSLIALLLVTFLIVVSPRLSQAQENSPIGSNSNYNTVVLDGNTLFAIPEALGETSPEERSRETTSQVEKFAKTTSLPIESLMIGDQNGIAVIFSGDSVIAKITEADARAANTTPRELGDAYLEKLKSAVSQYREKYSLSDSVYRGSILDRALEFISSLTIQNNQLNYTNAILYTIIATVLFVAVLIGTNKIFGGIFNKLNYQLAHNIKAIEIPYIPFFSDRINEILIHIIKWIRLLVNLLFATIYLVLILNLFPWTKHLGATIWQKFISASHKAWGNLISYIPNLFTVTIIIIVTYYVLRIINSIFRELGKGTISFPGFYPEWAEPTYRLLSLLIIGLVGVIIFPYLPGFGSASFQGISIFLGVLVSLGSSAAVSNAVAGIILIYTRAFQVGDRIEIAGPKENVKGDVEEKSLLVTRIRTGLNIIVTIPNSSLLSSNIKNYSASKRDSNRPVIIATRVNFSYHLPWQTVYEILTNAAKITPYVLADPPPGAFQRYLNDSSVTYQLEVYTDYPNKEFTIWSELHKNIRDKCNEAGIEILSPDYSAIRDGNRSTIPDNYLPKNYTPEGFNLHPLGNLFQIDLKWGAGDKNGKPSHTPEMATDGEPNRNVDSLES